jgi:hypothetical protein
VVIKATCFWKRKRKNAVEETTQAFYIHKNRLLYAREGILSIYNPTDSIGWSARFLFQKNKLVDMNSTGHGKSEDENWNAEREVLANYKAVLRQINLHISRLKTNAAAMMAVERPAIAAYGLGVTKAKRG